MLAIIPIQDLLAMDQGLRRENPAEERINIPAQVNHYWKYRLHIPLESLLKELDFNNTLFEMLDKSGRSRDF